MSTAHRSSAPVGAPLIGITGRRGRGSLLGGPSGFHDAPLEIYLSEYASSVAKAGGIPVNLPFDSDPRGVAGRLDGLLLSGGEDVDPRLYGQAPGLHTIKVDPLRDRFEVQLLDAAIARGVPVLGICRGLQVINVALGGTLIQHLSDGDGESHGSWAYPRQERVHRVVLLPGSRGAQLYGPETEVNSFHHQAIDQLGDDLVATGRASDGVIEVIEHRSAALLGVQWHPEVFGSDQSFSWLIETAAATSSRDESSRIEALV